MDPKNFLFILIILSCAMDTISVTTEMASYNTCEDNNTCIIEENTTLVTDSTVNENTLYTTDFTLVNETKNVSINITYKKPKKRHFDKDVFCWCNLKVNFCDINCCCDNDCTHEQKLIFSHCQTTKIYYEPYYCYSTSIIYINNTPVNWVRNNYGLFCIVKENLPAYHISQVQEPILSVNTAQDLIEDKYTWPGSLYQTEDDFIRKTLLKHGDKIWIKHKNSDITTLSLPNNFLSTTCIESKDIEFLNDFTTTCNQILDENNPDLNAATYYDNVTVLSFSILQNSSTLEDYLLDCPKTLCLPIQTFLCNEFLENCVKMNGNRSLPKISCHFNASSKEKSCFFVVKRVKYLVYHNGTYGFTNIHLFLHLTSVTQYLNDNFFQFNQNFEVKFLWHNSENNVSSILSGNPGYIIGKPILFSRVVNKINKNTTDSIIVEKVFVKNDFDFTRNFLVLPKNVNGYCNFNNQTFESVEFGYNSVFFCMHKAEFNRSTNATEICCKLQKELLSNWQIHFSHENLNNSEMYVGMFGNANRSEISEWIEILYNFDSKLFENVTGFFKDNILVCKNFAKTLKINILYSNIEFKNVHSQPKILNVFYDLKLVNTVSIISSNCKNYTCNGGINVLTEIMFFDVTYKKNKKFVEPPKLNIKLPPDFFYPFMSGSISNKIFNNEKIFIFAYLVSVYMLGSIFKI